MRIKKISISLFLILVSLSAQPTFANESNDELYKKVFGDRTDLKEVQASAVFEERIVGDIRVRAQGRKLHTINRSDLVSTLHHFVYDEKIIELNQLPEEIPVGVLPFRVNYIFNDLILEMDIPNNWIKPNEQSFLDDFIPYYSKKSVDPATFSFQLNYKAEYLYQSNRSENNSILGVVDNAINLRGLVLDNSYTYQEKRKEHWYRESTVLTYDFHDQLTRLQAGDVTNNTIGFLQSKNLGGVSLFRDFSLNPYRVSYPTSRFDFTLIKRSLVRTYVNNLLIKSEYLNPGKHTLKDIPLNNGVNKIIIEIEDEFGEKKILTFNEANSQDLLARGQSRFDLSAGKISKDLENRKDYNSFSDIFYSTFLQYGHRKNLTVAAYTQGLGSFSIYGAQSILASKRGNLILDFAKSKNEEFSGMASRLTYQLNLFGPYWYDSHTLTARVEKRSPEFNETEVKSTNFFDLISNLTYAVPISDALSASLGGNFSKSRDGRIADKWGGDLAVSAKIGHDANLTFSYARNRDEYKKWQNLSYVFLNFNLPEKSTYVSGFYDHQSNLQRLTAIHDNGGRLNDLKVAAVAEKDIEGNQVTLDSSYNMQLLDMGLRLDSVNPKQNEKYYRVIPRVLGGLSFVYDNGNWGGAVSRPINGSFAIFKPHKEFKDQAFGIRSYGNITESKTGLFSEALLTGLNPYQYRQVQLDPTFLEPGFSLGQESFVLYPHYKSGHLFIVGVAGQIALRGMLVDSKNKELSYKVGYLIESGNSEKIIPFFSNKNGQILIEGIAPTKYRVQVEDYEEVEVDFKGSKGFVDFGNFKLLSKKEAL